MLLKTVNVTNARNVLVQVPSALIAKWCLIEGDHLEVSVNADNSELIIKPRQNLSIRRSTIGQSEGLARTAGRP
jgi:hypothetical protein